jgi:hypothetical protein
MINALKGQLKKKMKLTSSEINELIENVSVETKTIKTYCKYTRVYGQKL